MILQALDAYYRRKQTDPDPAERLPSLGLEDKEIPFLVELAPDGQCLGLSDTRRGEGKKRAGQRYLVPQGVKKTSGVAANLLWDTVEYVLGLDTRGKPQRVAEQMAAFRARIQALPPAAQSDVGVQAVLRFLEAVPLEALSHHPLWPELQAANNPLVSFRLQGDLGLICQRPLVLQSVQSPSETPADGVCLISGQRAEVERLHPAIKGVWGAQTAGANIVSFNLAAFDSYGKSQGHNAPVGKPAVFAYTTALNHLLAKDSRQRFQVGDASTVVWAEEPHELEHLIVDAFGDPPRDDPDRHADAIKALYASAASGRFAQGADTTSVHVLGLAPNAARISIRFWITATAKELGQRMRQHFDDLEVVHGPKEPERLSLFRLLVGVAAQGKADNIPPNLAGAVVRAVFDGVPYPSSLLQLAVVRCRAERHPNQARAAAIKACLNRSIRFYRTTEREFTPMLDPSNSNPGYRLGRLFATLEKIQEEASPGLNATIRDRYYGAASSTPAAVFATLLRLKNHHLGKLHAGRAVNLERLLMEILAALDDFPSQLPLQDQGRFALGYYHQRQAFFTKNDTHPTPSTEE